MIKYDEVIRLESNINKLLTNSQKRQLIYKSIFGDEISYCFNMEFSEKLDRLMSNKEYIELNEEAKNFIINLPRLDLCNLLISFSIGRLGNDYEDFQKEYNHQLDKVDSLYEDKMYIENKLIDIDHEYLEKYLTLGLEYIKRNIN